MVCTVAPDAKNLPQHDSMLCTFLLARRYHAPRNNRSNHSLFVSALHARHFNPRINGRRLLACGYPHSSTALDGGSSDDVNGLPRSTEIAPFMTMAQNRHIVFNKMNRLELQRYFWLVGDSSTCPPEHTERSSASSTYASQNK